MLTRVTGRRDSTDHSVDVPRNPIGGGTEDGPQQLHRQMYGTDLIMKEWKLKKFQTATVSIIMEDSNS